MRAFLLAGAVAVVQLSMFGIDPATAAVITFSQLTGLTGGSPPDTAVFKADLSSLPLGEIASVTIRDNSSTSAGSPGQFSGFDLDAIVLSSTNITSASQVSSLVPTGTFNFATSVLTDGAQTPPTDPALFGTTGGQVNQAVATLNAFDGNSTTAIPGAFGFVSLGVGGVLGINLTNAVATGGPLYLYIGEVGNNGEVAASNIDVSSSPIGVPEPASLALLTIGVASVVATRRRRTV